MTPLALAVGFPMTSAVAPDVGRNDEVRELFVRMGEALKEHGRIYIHCSAGIHRTGMITYGFLRASGLTSDAARALISELRLETGVAVGEYRLEWGDSLAVTDQQ